MKKYIRIAYSHLETIGHGEIIYGSWQEETVRSLAMKKNLVQEMNKEYPYLVHWIDRKTE